MNRLILQFTAHLHVRQYSESSIQNHRLDLLRFKDWLEEHKVSDPAKIGSMTGEDILSYQNFLSKRLKPRSINRHLSSLRLFFRYLEEDGMVGRNPMDNVVFPKPLPNLPTMLLPGEVSALLEAPIETHYLGLRDKALLEVLYSTGIKLNELIALNVEDLQLDLGYVKVRGRRSRMVPLTDKVSKLLHRFLEESRPKRVLHTQEACVFPGRNGTRISRVGVWKLIKKYAQQAGIRKNFNPRALRHAFAIHLILGGMDLDGIKFLFGYKKLEAAALYAHVNAPNFQNAYRVFHPHAAKSN
ncbi:MAG: tyrosine-type recombinase/integrase [Deltaproteobacteria bacterium]|nr:tyrosine-type recombinase/integrase [Deltaproteobacteria bacterium]